MISEIELLVALSHTITVLIGVGLIYMTHQTAMNQTIMSKKMFDLMRPETTLIMVDLHGVVFTSNYFGMIKTFLKSGISLSLIFNAFRPSMLRIFFDLWRKSTSPEGYLVAFLKQYPGFRPHTELFFYIANDQSPRWPIIEVLLNFKKAGYRIHGVSNIGQFTLQHLTLKFPTIINIFEYIQTSQANQEYRAKPAREYYRSYILATPIAPQQRLFFENSLENIMAARSMNVFGTDYRSLYLLNLYKRKL